MTRRSGAQSSLPPRFGGGHARAVSAIPATAARLRTARGHRRACRAAWRRHRTRRATSAEHDSPGNDVGMAVEVLRCRMQDQVRTQRERPGEHGRRYRGVDGQEGAAVMGYLCRGGDVGDGPQRDLTASRSRPVACGRAGWRPSRRRAIRHRQMSPRARGAVPHPPAIAAVPSTWPSAQRRGRAAPAPGTPSWRRPCRTPNSSVRGPSLQSVSTSSTWRTVALSARP